MVWEYCLVQRHFIVPLPNTKGDKQILVSMHPSVKLCESKSLETAQQVFLKNCYLPYVVDNIELKF